MLQFSPMKTVGKITLRFLIAFFATMMIASVIWMSGVVLDTGTQDIVPRAIQILMASIPLAIVSAAFITFFLLNRLIHSRLLGYIMISVIAGMTMVATSLLIRFGIVAIADGFLSLPDAYIPIARWMRDIALAPWPTAVAGIASFALFSSAFWGSTRLSRNRPLLGAFIAPSAAILAVYLFGLYLSGPADALFSFLDVEIPRLLSTAILSGASALALFLLDALLATKPEGASRNA